MMIQKITSFVDFNQWLKRLDTQPNELINQIQLKSPNLSTNKKSEFKTLGTSIINSTLFPLSLIYLS